MFIALVLMALCAMDASAGLKRVALTTDMFFEWNGWGADAQKKSETPANCVMNLGKATQEVFGDMSVINYADLSTYKTLEIYYTSGTPRVLLNRDVAGGNWNANEADSHLIEYPAGGGDKWSGKYFIEEEGLLKVDLAQLVADKGFAHLHAIKGANWTNCVVTKLALISDNGRVELESEMFHAWTTADADAEIIENPEPFSGGETFGCEVGYFKNVDGGAVIYGNGNVIWQWYADLTGTKKMYFTGEKGISFRILYNRLPPQDGDTDAHGHACPEKTVSIGDDGTAVFDVEAFMAENSLTFFHVNCIKIGWGASSLRFGNVELEGSIQGSGKIYDPLDDITAGFQSDVVSINLGKNTNLKNLLNGQERILFPIESGKLTVNGNDIKLLSVEGFFDNNNNARVFLFMDNLTDAIDDADNETADVKTSFINPSDPAMQLVLASGRFEGTVIPDIKDLKATFEDGLANYYSNQAKLPVLVAAVPELGSINLPVGKTDFKVTFSGKVNAAELKAKFDGADMTIAPAEGFSAEFTLTRAAGDVTPGVHEIVLSNIKAEQDLFEEVGEESIKYSFGTVDSEESVETLMTDGFAESGNGTVPAAWIVDNDGEDRTGVTGLWGGCRVVETSGSFATHVLYMCSRGYNGDDKLNDGHAIYGANDQKLTLEAKTYKLTADVGGWDGTNRALKIQILPESSEVALLEELIPVTVQYTSGKNHVDIDFTIETPGNYILKFFPCNTEGNPAGWGDALALGNIKVQYIPDVMGIEMTQALKQALADATNVRDANTADRYAGEAFTTLDNLIKASDPKVLQTPTEFEKAAADLKVAAEAMTAHHKLCDDFDALPAQLYAKIEQFADSKFAADPIYTEMQTVFAKYATVVDEEQVVEEQPQVVKVVKPNLVTDDAELKSGIDEMNAAIAKASMLTEGASQNGTTGYAALHERLRLGVATATALGVEGSDAAVLAANAVFGDNDDVANSLKAAITKKLYANLSTDPTVNEPIDMTVFIKNPNIYVTKTSKQDVDAAPGWTINNIGGGNLGDIWYIAGGGTHLATDVVPADEAITSTGNITFTQEITDLPAGVYQVTAYMGERRGDNDFKGFGEGETDEDKLADARTKIFPQEFVFVNTTATAEGAYDHQTPVTTNGTSWGATDNNRIISENITITDGKATIGVKSSGQNTWFAFNEIHLSLVAAAEGFDYGKEPDGIETVKTADKANNGVIYNLSGQKVSKSFKGIVIMNGKKFVVK